MRYFVLLAFFLIYASPVLATHEEIRFPGKTPSEESLAYDISFLWFDRLAEGHLTFTTGDRPGTYRAVLEARTKGVAARLSGNRAQRYVSDMETGPDGKLRALSHESQILRGRGENRREARTRRYIFDHNRGEVLHQRIRDGRITVEEIVPFDQTDPPADMLTALYNFRAGIYGHPGPGEPVVIPAFSHRGDSDIVVELLTKKERERLPFPSQGKVCRVTLDPEVFDTGGGSVYVWFNEEGKPASGLVENVKGMGDVRGTVR
jgi:hypothetical protein